MYVDNELTAEERAAVDLFARQNPDLASELDVLMQTKLSADDGHIFMHKNDLLQKVETIGIDNYEDQFLLYIDNELPAERRNDVEKFVLQHPQFQDEFTLLKQTILPQETIVFENKAALLRTEDSRVIPMFLRFAVAAAVVGIAVLIWWLSGNNVTVVNDPQVAVNNTGKPSDSSNTENNVVATEDNQLLPEVNITAKQKQATSETASTTKKATDKKDNLPVQVKNNDKNQVAVTNNKTVHNNNAITTIASITPDEVRNNEPAKNTNISATNKPSYAVVQNNDTDPDKNNNTSFAKNNNPESSNNYVSQAVYKELNTEAEDNKDALYVGSLQINKNKVRGIVKKVGGLFAGRTKDASKEDGKLQIANLELNTN